VLVGSIRSACEDTSTVSVVEATERVIGNSDNEPTVIVKWENALVAKPGALTVSEYDAGGNDRMLYSPLPRADAGSSAPFASVWRTKASKICLRLEHRPLSGLWVAAEARRLAATSFDERLLPMISGPLSDGCWNSPERPQLSWEQIE